MSSTAKNWTDYDTLAKLAKGEVIESPPGNPYPYVAGRSREKKTGGRANPESGFYNLNRVPPDIDTPVREYAKTSGWKFHLSVHPDDVRLAWNSISEYLQQENIVVAKVASAATAREHADRIDHESGRKSPQIGKMLVIYVDDTIGGEKPHGDKDWQRIINGIETRLAEAGVRPGEAVITDKPVKDSMYTYYRSDAVTKLMEKAYDGIKESNELLAIGSFVEKEKARLGDDFAKTEKWGSPEEIAFNAAIADIIDNPPLMEKVRVPRDEMLDFIKLHMNAAATGFTADDLEKLVPETNADLMASRLKLIELPPDKRYKLPVEEDRFAGLAIEQPNALRARQELSEKARGVNAR